MEARGRKGQIIIFIVLILIFAIIAIAVFSGFFGGRKSAPSVLDAFWRVDNKRVTSATVGETVDAYVSIQASEQYVGSIVIKVRKDVSFWFDKDYAVATVPVNMVGGGEPALLKVEFIPDEASGGSLRGYFIEVDFSAVGATWTMDKGYPPRLQVTAVQT